MLSLVAVLGLWIGSWKVYGVGLGIGGVLFGGIFVGHFSTKYGIELNMDALHFIQEFGLILFVYTIGIQVGPGFFTSLRSSGMRLNGFATLLVLLSCIVTAVLYKLFDVPLPIILGIFSGAVTNTPSLGAGQQIMGELGATSGLLGQTGMGYAIAYPFGILGILFTMWIIRWFFRVNINEEAESFNNQTGKKNSNLNSINVELHNVNLDGLMIKNIPIINSGRVVCTRLKHADELLIPTARTIVKMGDLLNLVGDQKSLDEARLIIGEVVDGALSTKGTNLRSVRVVVTADEVLNKKIGELNLIETYDVVISRLHRSGIELVPSSSMSLQFGDILNLVGRQDAIDTVGAVVGNAEQKLQQVQMLPVFIGIGLGMLVGSIPISIPGFPVALKLGLAGGPLIVALILARIGSIGKLYWFMPPSANLALREIGIVLFLAVVGLKSGGQFLETLTEGDGLIWMCYGIAITFIPLITVGFIARIFTKINYLSLCGMLAGSMTDPPALAFANGLHSTSGASALAYATVYPLVMFLRILSPQIMALLLWAG
jgi:putative transport protein